MDCYRLCYLDFIALVSGLNKIGKRTYGYSEKTTVDWTPEMVLGFQFSDGHRRFVLDEDVNHFPIEALELIAHSIFESFSDAR